MVDRNDKDTSGRVTTDHILVLFNISCCTIIEDAIFC